MSRPGRLDGRTCLIVGGTGGIGLASAARFLEEGARVVVAGRSEERGRAGVAELVASGSVWEFTLDLAAGESETARLFEFAVDVLGGRLDVLLHVAGISGRRFGDAGLTYLTAKQPIAGGPGRATDVAEAALYLCEPASRFITGAELVVDGGWCVSEGMLPDDDPSELRAMSEQLD